MALTGTSWATTPTFIDPSRRSICSAAARTTPRCSDRALRTAAPVRRGALLPAQPSAGRGRDRPREVAATPDDPVLELRSTTPTTPARSRVLEPLRGAGGMLGSAASPSKRSDQAEDHLLLAASSERRATSGCRSRRSAVDHSGAVDGSAASSRWMPRRRIVRLGDWTTSARSGDAVRRTISERRRSLFEAEADKLDGWADDLKLGLEREIKELDRQIKEARRRAATSPSRSRRSWRRRSA